MATKGIKYLGTDITKKSSNFYTKNYKNNVERN
jgi:hypothetical protein